MNWLRICGVVGVLGLLVACGAATPDEGAEGQGATAVREDAPTAVDADAEPVADTPPESEPTAGDEPAESFAGTVPAPEFPPGLDWLNTPRPLSLSELRGKVVLLDFWTYGCINCIHVIPDLKRLEEKYADELVVIGVHSAKFTNEGETENIRRIVQRYEVVHPVVNDKDFIVWQTYGIQAWPTFVMIDPAGNVVGVQSGEGIYELFDFVIGNLVAEFEAQDAIDRTPLVLAPERAALGNSPLLFPGKVLADAAGQRLFIADSNHNRIVIADFDGRVTAVIGSGQADLRDGDFASAAFFRPQGLALADPDTLYVADTENHVIRRVDLAAGRVQTAAGVGAQATQRVSGGPAYTTPLNSPWDVLWQDGLLYIAMAGPHQLWVYNPAIESIGVFAGSGLEELTDGPLLRAGLNQPSGLATDGTLLYIADSEASAIRTADLDPAGVMTTIVGTGLFDFGDVDGRGAAVRLQHPLGVVYDDGILYVADTYNSKIKVVDPATRSSETLFGGAEAGWQDGASALLDEPGGLSLADGRLYIADTNNHVVRIADLATGELSTLVLLDPDGLLTRVAADAPFPGIEMVLPAQSVAAGPGTIRLDILLPDGYKVNDLAPFSMTWSGPTFAESDARQSIIAPTFPLEIPVSFGAEVTAVTGDLVLYYCEAESASLCLIEQLRITVPVTIDSNGASDLEIEWEVVAPGGG